MACLSLCLAALHHGCLVEAYEFPEDVNATVDLRSDGMPEIGTISQLGAPPPSALTYRVRVTHRDVEQDLYARWSTVTGGRGEEFSLHSQCNVDKPVDVDPVDAGVALTPEPVIPADGNLERGFQFSVASSFFAQDGCYRIDLAVSPEFKLNCAEVVRGAPTLFATPRIPDTVGIAHWYLLVGDGPLDCPSEPFPESF